jgi:hypothetical protein
LRVDGFVTTEANAGLARSHTAMRFRLTLTLLPLPFRFARFSDEDIRRFKGLG